MQKGNNWSFSPYEKKKSKLELYEEKEQGSLVLYVTPTGREDKIQSSVQVCYVSIKYHFSLPKKSVS